MSQVEHFSKKIMKFLASLKLAVIVIVSLAVICAYGTIVESQFNSEIAQKLVYRSFYMYLVLILLVINLIAVMIDRLPWKIKHMGFILAHIGIITVLLGAFITQKQGLDGSISFDIGDTNSFVSTTTTDLVVYELKNFDQYTKIYNQDVDFFLNNPKKSTVEIDLQGEKIRIIDHMPFSNRKSVTTQSERAQDGPAIRFQLKNKFANVNDWFVQKGSAPAIQNFGPVKIILNTTEFEPTEKGNIIVLWPDKKNSKANLLNYKVINRDENLKNQRGILKKGDAIHTNWMGDFEFLIINYFRHGKINYEYTPRPKPNEFTVPAILVEFNGKKQWIGLNANLELFAKDKSYILSYANHRVPLGFNMKLLNFDVSHYKGTNTAMSYESHVEVAGRGNFLISMNEPFKHNGYTFYQASFEQDETGKPTASILSVNRDPGRPLKYLGCIILIVGTIYMFYSRRLRKQT